MSIQATSITQNFLTADEFASFRRAHGLTPDEVSRWLGVSPAEYADMEKRGVPRIAALALSAIDYGLDPWTPAVLGSTI